MSPAFLRTQNVERRTHSFRIGIDARAYDWTGIGRYARNLLRELSTLARETGTFQLTVFVPDRFLPEVERLPQTTAVRVSDSYYSVSEQTHFLMKLLRHRVDLMHFLSFNVPLLYRRPFVVTIHDLTRFSFPGQKHQGWVHQLAYEQVFRSTVRHAKQVIAVSHTTADTLTQRFPSVKDRLQVIPEGIEEAFADSDGARGAVDRARLEARGIRAPFLLYVGLWMRHKNLATLLEAFHHIRARGYPGTLVMTGEGRPWDEDPRAYAQAAGVAPYVLMPGRVPDEVLRALYRSADAFLFPSLSEGFGLPPLEAMACGTPVVAARAGSLPEILGEAALYVDPLSARQLADAVLLLVQERSVRERLVRAGKVQASRYRWDSCALNTAALYARVLGHPLPKSVWYTRGYESKEREGTDGLPSR